MVSPDELKKIIASFTGKELSDSDIMDYAHFLKGSEDAFDEEKKERISSDLASIVMHSPSLAKKVAEEYRKQAGEEKDIELINFLKNPNSIASRENDEMLNDLMRLIGKNRLLYQKIDEMYKKQVEKQKQKDISERVMLDVYDGFPSHQIGLVTKLSGEGIRKLASAPELYLYLKTLKQVLLKGTHTEITNARKRISQMKSNMPLLTSTRLFYDARKNNQQQSLLRIVHNYGSPVEEQIYDEIVLPIWPNYLMYDTKNAEGKKIFEKDRQEAVNLYWKAVQTMFQTKDCIFYTDNRILHAFRLVCPGMQLEQSLFPDANMYKDITCGTVYLDHDGLHLFKCGTYFKEKWGRGLYKDASTNKK